jgi:hypothetical protein
MVRVVYPGFCAALIRVASLVSAGQGQSRRNKDRGGEDGSLCVAVCESGDWPDVGWHMEGLLPRGEYAPRAITQPPAFTGYAEVRQNVGYLVGHVPGPASRERSGRAAKNDVFQQRG